MFEFDNQKQKENLRKIQNIIRETAKIMKEQGYTLPNESAERQILLNRCRLAWKPTREELFSCFSAVNRHHQYILREFSPSSLELCGEYLKAAVLANLIGLGAY